MNTDNLSTNSGIYLNFVNPPRGYGNVPFYWWNGVVLDTGRIDSQLRLLSAGGVIAVLRMILNREAEGSEKHTNVFLQCSATNGGRL